MARRSLQLGDEHEDVNEWQRIVGVTQDGKFGRLTEAATVGFQRALGIVPSNGVVDEETWRVIHCHVLPFVRAKVGSPEKMHSTLRHQS
jgi:peptidoglycan hydrolase-like protein with peptidoglycan-binding domain